ncbi:hypothetical protein DFJ77DRAFT_322148 [Powellomyces hirtus]|nr:hypothetical protein DFJ77DRAFT_322148 [Powellomyces hirtus]
MGRKHPSPLFTPSTLSKRRGEAFFLRYSACWVSFFALIVLSQAYENFTPTHYMLVGLGIFLPAIVLPILYPHRLDDPSLPWTARYTTKANIWIAIYSFIANHFWTHYFYKVLHVRYTFEAYRVNDVPLALHFVTHGYFILYHTIATRAGRLVWRALGARDTFSNYIVMSALVVAGSVATAFMETWTIKSFPYYVYPDQHAMYTVGSMFYALYFVVSYPMFARIDEKVADRWTISRTVGDVLAACMAVTFLLDAWRLLVGPLKFDLAESSLLNTADELPWMHHDAAHVK